MTKPKQTAALTGTSYASSDDETQFVIRRLLRDAGSDTQQNRDKLALLLHNAGCDPLVLAMARRREPVLLCLNLDDREIIIPISAYVAARREYLKGGAA